MDKKTFTHIYNMYFPSLCYFSFNLTGNMLQAEDIASESLSKLWQRRSGFTSQAAIKSFLYTTARNASLNYLKSLRVRTSAHEELLYLAEEKDDYILANMIQAQLLRYIYDEIEELPPRMKAIFKMIFEDGLSTAEIAREMNIQEQSVRNAKKKSLDMLKIRMIELGLIKQSSARG